MSVGMAVHDWDGRIEKIAIELLDIAVDRVYLCVEDRHILWRHENVIEAIEALKDNGLKVYLDPWGVGGFFAGETTHTDSRTAFLDFLDLAECADGVLIDEARDDALRLVAAQTRLCSKAVEVTLQPERLDQLKYFDPDSVSISTYNFGANDWSRRYERLDEWLETMPSTAAFWVQTWGIPEGDEFEDFVPYAIEKIVNAGRDVNIWSYEATRTVSSIRSRRYEDIWESVLSELRWLAF